MRRKKEILIVTILILLCISGLRNKPQSEYRSSIMPTTSTHPLNPKPNPQSTTTTSSLLLPPTSPVPPYLPNKLPLLYKETDPKILNYTMTEEQWKKKLNSPKWKETQHSGTNKKLSGGYTGVAEKHFGQLVDFREKASKGAYSKINGDHFDWWMALGCYDKSAYGTDFAVYMDDIEYLKKYNYDGTDSRYKDWNFRLAHMEGISLLLRAVGWCDQNDNVTGEIRCIPIGERVGKFLNSALLFAESNNDPDYKVLYEKLNSFAHAVLRYKGKNFYASWVKKYMTDIP